MAVETYTLSGQTTFQFPHQVRAKDQIEFLLDGLPYSPVYTVTGLGNNTSGVTFAIPSVPGTGTLTIKTIAVASRVTDFLANSAITPTSLDDEFNNLITITGDLRIDVDDLLDTTADHEARLDILEDAGGTNPDGEALRLSALRWDFQNLRAKNVPAPTAPGDILRYGDVDFSAGGFPAFAGNANKFLMTDGLVPLWQFVDTANIATNAVTYAKMQSVSAASRVLGRGSSGAGNVQELTPGGGLEISSTTLRIAAQGVTSSKIADDAVTSSKIATNAVTSGKIADDAVTSSKIATNAVTSGKIADEAVTYAKMQDVTAASRVLGRGSSGAGNVQELTPGGGLEISSTTLRIAAQGVTEARLASNAVTADKVRRGVQELIGFDCDYPVGSVYVGTRTITRGDEPHQIPVGAMPFLICEKGPHGKPLVLSLGVGGSGDPKTEVLHINAMSATPWTGLTIRVYYIQETA